MLREQHKLDLMSVATPTLQERTSAQKEAKYLRYIIKISVYRNRHKVELCAAGKEAKLTAALLNVVCPMYLIL